MQKVTVYLLPVEKVKEYPKAFFSENFPNRFEKAENFAFENDKLRSLGVAVLLKEKLNLTEADIILTEKGKPYSTACKKKFSISHSGEYAALAAGDGNIGLDIQIIDKSKLKLASRIFTPDEAKWVNDSPQRFFTVWTLKEALCKAIGTGISKDGLNINVLPLAQGGTLTKNGITYHAKCTEHRGHAISVVAEEAFDISLVIK